MKDDDLWEKDAERFGWELPFRASWPWRLPVIRRFRAVWHALKVDRHYAFYSRLGLARTGYDEWVIYAIARGWA